jgi:hypothetical protein
MDIIHSQITIAEVKDAITLFRHNFFNEIKVADVIDPAILKKGFDAGQ